MPGPFQCESKSIVILSYSEVESHYSLVIGREQTTRQGLLVWNFLRDWCALARGQPALIQNYAKFWITYEKVDADDYKSKH